VAVAAVSWSVVTPPDGTRFGYKKRVGRSRWLYVLDLATMKETPLAEERSIEDHVEWLDAVVVQR
jgi:hypothetical protein